MKLFAKDVSFWALIPARAGSVSIPRKNIQNVNGKPLIYWTIKAALKSQRFDRVIVSTDDEEFGRLSMKFGAEAPFKRPRELAKSITPTMDVVIHFLRWLKNRREIFPDYMMLLQPTSPLRTSSDIQQVIQIAARKNADSVVSVCAAKHHPYWTKRIQPDQTLVDFLKGQRKVFRRQDLPQVYVLNGAIYLCKTDLLLRKKTFYSEQTYAYVMPPERSIDIDSPLDLFLADVLLRRRFNDKPS